MPSNQKSKQPNLQKRPVGRPPKPAKLNTDIIEQDALDEAKARGTLNERDVVYASHGFLFRLDMRERRARNLLAAYSLYCDYLGGEDELSFGQKELIRRAAGIAVECSDLEERLAEDRLSKDDFDRYMSATKTLTSLLRQVGMERVPKLVVDSEPETLEEYLEDVD